MAEQLVRVKVEKDHIQKLASAKPIPALAELIWNAVDGVVSLMRTSLQFSRDSRS